MRSGYAILLSGTFVAASLLWLTIYCWFRVLGREVESARRELIRWAVRGLATPIVFLFAWNLAVFAGWLEGVVPLLPGLVINARQYVDIGPQLALGAGATLMVVTSYWAAFALARLLPELPREEMTKDDLKFWAIIYGVFVLPPAGLLAWWLGAAGIGFVVVVLAMPLLQILGRHKHKPVPMYAKAVARMKFGKYAEAEQEVIRQLEQCENDYDGWMMLAQLYAESFHELDQAEATVRELCDQPDLTPFQVSQAFNRLADWQLRLGSNIEGTRRALREVIARTDGTPFARTAQFKLKQLPHDQEELAEQRAPKRIRLPSLSDGSVASQPAEKGAPRREEARRQIDRWRVRLELSPDDFDLRERIAVLQAEELGDAKQAIATIEALLAHPDLPAERVPVWLAHLATWQLKLRHDEPAARRLLERLLREYPGTPHAYGASAQLWALEQASFASQHPVAAPEAAPKIRVQLDQPPA